MSLLPFGRSLRFAHASSETSIAGGVLWGFLGVWCLGYAAARMLGENAPTAAEGGLFAPTNLVFFIVLEILIGVGGAFLTRRTEPREALVRLAFVVFFAGTAISMIAFDGAEGTGGTGLVLARSFLNALGVMTLYWLSAPRASGASQGPPTCNTNSV